MKEFRVNNFITLRLEDGWTIIYVAGIPFQHCKYLLLNINIENLSDFDEIDSIDEAAEQIDRSMEAGSERPSTSSISLETEFWGHCSNLQVWYENKYDTRLLHSNIAFPLLKKLVDYGDPLAKKVFKEEIAKRFTSNHLTVVSFLTKNDYLMYLDIGELKALKVDLSDKAQSCIKDILLEMFQEGFKKINYNEYQNKLYEILNIFHDEKDLEQIKYVICKGIKYIVNNGFLRVKNVDNIQEIQGLNTIKGVKRLALRGRNLSEICCLEHLIELEELHIRYANIIKIENLENLSNLKLLDLGRNKITEIDGLNNLNNLNVLNLSGNQIHKIENLDNLINLEELILAVNQIGEIEGLDYLFNLTYLNLSVNQISEIKGLKNLKKLLHLNLGSNTISEIKGLKGLYSLKHLQLDDNGFLDPYENREYWEKDLARHT